MKICILTGKFGMGHMSAALAIKQQIEEENSDADVEVIDWISYVSPKLAEKCYGFFTLLINNKSGFYNAHYRLSENKRTNKRPELSVCFHRYFTRFMEEKQPDLIISTLPLCSQIVSLYKEKTGSGIPLITCVTDITGHSEWISKNTSFYLVGSQSVKEKFMEKGVNREKIHVTGIPVRREFTNQLLYGKKDANRPGKRLLIMGGGLGILPEDNEFYDRLNTLRDVEVTIVTGKNQTLYKRLSGSYRNIRVLGYVTNIYDYMKQADAVITKPGGITTFEAIHSEVPILALQPFLQQEIYNAQFITETNIGTVINGDSRNCLKEIRNILEYGQLEKYRKNIRKIKNQLEENSLAQIVEEAVNEPDQITENSFRHHYHLISKRGAVNEKISFNV